MGGIAFLFYVGGIGAFPAKKIGFWVRVLWPYILGRAVAQWAFNYAIETQDPEAPQ